MAKNSFAAEVALSTNPIRWSTKLTQFVGNLPTNCSSVFDHFVEFPLKGLRVSFDDTVPKLGSFYGANFCLTSECPV